MSNTRLSWNKPRKKGNMKDMTRSENPVTRESVKAGTSEENRLVEAKPVPDILLPYI